MKKYMLQTDTMYKYEPESTDGTEDDMQTIKNSSAVHMLSWHSFVKQCKREKHDGNLAREGGAVQAKRWRDQKKKEKELMDFLSE